MTRPSPGFTLIELLVVLALIGILSSLVYPSYTRQAVKARRIEAQMALLEAMGRQEQYRALHHAYLAFSQAASDPGSAQFNWWIGHRAAASAYELDGYACPGQDIAQCIELRARPGTLSVNARFADPDCGTLTLDSTGVQAASGPAAGCWP